MVKGKGSPAYCSSTVDLKKEGKTQRSDRPSDHRKGKGRLRQLADMKERVINSSKSVSWSWKEGASYRVTFDLEEKKEKRDSISLHPMAFCHCEEGIRLRSLIIGRKERKARAVALRASCALNWKGGLQSCVRCRVPGRGRKKRKMYNGGAKKGGSSSLTTIL